MGKINLGRVVLGGLLAGLVINIGESLLNILVLGGLWEYTLKMLNRPPMSTDAGAMVFYIVIGFAVGIFLVWLYAAIRPRFGAGASTALCAGLIAWFLASMYTSAGLLMMNIFPRRLLLYSVVWEFVQLPLATLAGAWLYKEEA